MKLDCSQTTENSDAFVSRRSSLRMKLELIGSNILTFARTPLNSRRTYINMIFVLIGPQRYQETAIDMDCMQGTVSISRTSLNPSRHELC